MTFLDLATQIIPGYDFLTDKQRALFEASDAGQAFTEFVDKKIADQGALYSLRGVWTLLTASFMGLLGGSAEQEKNLQALLGLENITRLEKIKISEAYQSVVKWIAFNVLEVAYPDFVYLEKDQQEALANTFYTQDLLGPYFLNARKLKAKREELSKNQQAGPWSQMLEMVQLNNEIQALETEKTNLIIIWNEAFSKNVDSAEREQLSLTSTTNKIAEREKKRTAALEVLTERVQELAKFFPISHSQTSTEDMQMLDELCVSLFSERGELTTEEKDKVTQQYLSKLLMACMRKISGAEIDFMDLDKFNAERAELMAKVIFDSFKVNTALQLDALDALFANYEAALLQKIMDQLQYYKPPPKVATQGILELSYSYLFQNKTVENAKKLLGKLADAHAFIQATGFSTQNESSMLAGLDIFNYVRHMNQIAETKSIIASLLKPFRPIYEEYRDIGLHEKSAIKKVFRALMPIFIITGVIVAAGFLLSPFGLPTLPLIAAFIPVIIIAFGMAAEYISIKNRIYKSVREYWWGGPFKIPEFQVNKRMRTAFPGENCAENIRDIYVKKISHCDNLEASLSCNVGSLTGAQITQRTENIQKRHQLCMEWYDIHSNEILGTDRLPEIVKARLYEEEVKEYQQLECEVQRESIFIRSQAKQITSHLKELVVTPNGLPRTENDGNANHVRLDRSIEPRYSPGYSPGLFKRFNCVGHYKHLEEMTQLSTQIESVGLI